MRPSAALLFAVLGSAVCERAPPEDFTQRGTSTAAAPPPPAPSRDTDAPSVAMALPIAPPARDDGRCVQPTPNEPPPPVPAGPAPGCPSDPEGGPGKLPIVRVGFPGANGTSVDAELVRSEHDTMRGLMYRKSMGPDRGMLFDLRVRDDHKFWMHNTCIPLDLLYIDEDGLLVGIVENAPTLDDDSRGVGCPSRWVLEVNAGWSRRHAVKAGQHVELAP
jgi:uncharacterized membrane protein (UPF0127 family)